MLLPILIALIAVAIGTIIWIRNGQKQRFRERGWALLILLIGTLLTMGMLFHVPISNPIDWITTIFYPVLKPIKVWIEEGGQPR